MDVGGDGVLTEIRGWGRRHWVTQDTMSLGRLLMDWFDEKGAAVDVLIDVVLLLQWLPAS